MPAEKYPKYAIIKDAKKLFLKMIKNSPKSKLGLWTVLLEAKISYFTTTSWTCGTDNMKQINTLKDITKDAIL